MVNYHDEGAQTFVARTIFYRPTIYGIDQDREKAVFTRVCLSVCLYVGLVRKL